MQNNLICLFDLDGTLCGYDEALKKDMIALQSPSEQPYEEVPRDNAPAYLKARADLIRSNMTWWAELPRFKLGFDVWDLAERFGYRRVILTQGPKRNPLAWAGKKMWIDRNLGQDIDLIITRDKGLVYGKVLVDDWPEYVEKWLKHRPRGLVIMPASKANEGFNHSQVIRYDGSNFTDVVNALQEKSKNV